MKEQVNHPDHYNIPGKKECIVQMKEDYGEVCTAIFCLTNAYKYLYRAGSKEGNSQEQDIAKAKWYFSYERRTLNWEDTSDKYLYHNVKKLEEYVEKELSRYEGDNG